MDARILRHGAGPRQGDAPPIVFVLKNDARLCARVLDGTSRRSGRFSPKRRGTGSFLSFELFHKKNILVDITVRSADAALAFEAGDRLPAAVI
ncbi:MULTISPECIES: hypothetical protein [Methylobacterium]|nr:hypothetical protein [Methylobacterium aquaticum]